MLELSFPSRPLLCATNNSECRNILEEVMTGFRPVFVTSACDAIRTANSGIFDAYLIDYWLPDWAGAQLCRHIRATDPNAPILIFNGANQGTDRQRALRAGASAFFVKPMDSQALRTSLVNLLQIRDRQSVRARAEEQRAIEDELMRQTSASRERTEKARDLAVQANERIARAKAYRAFMEAGGMRSHFDRWWPQAYESIDRQSSS